METVRETKWKPSGKQNGNQGGNLGNFIAHHARERSPASATGAS